MLLSGLFSRKTYPTSTGYRPIYSGLGLTDLDASKVVVTDANKMLASGTNTDAEIVAACGVAVDGEIHLTPKASSGGPEGTVFYNQADDHIYVGTEL